MKASPRPAAVAFEVMVSVTVSAREPALAVEAATVRLPEALAAIVAPVAVSLPLPATAATRRSSW